MLFAGCIPENIGDLQQLESIDLHNNHLSGPIPTSVGALKSLQTLVLNKNELSGRVPSEVSQLLALEKLWLNDNKLTGKARLISRIAALLNALLGSLHHRSLHFIDLSHVTTVARFQFRSVTFDASLRSKGETMLFVGQFLHPLARWQI